MYLHDMEGSIMFLFSMDIYFQFLTFQNFVKDLIAI